MLGDAKSETQKNGALMQQSIQRRGIRKVWHLTYLNQLPNIFRAGGLLSRTQMDKLSIPYGMSGWGNEAKGQELRDYICCSVVCPWGMSKEQPETKALISLHPRVLLRNGVLFCGTWSSFNEVSLQTLLKNSSVEAFNLMFENPTSSFPAPPPGEFLVPNSVPISEFLSHIYFYDDATMKKAIELCGKILLPSGNNVISIFKFVVDRYCFRGRAQP